ncbi:MAG: hypothetical protein A2Z96_02745 [Spirochaetes bacterium GWB1_48_6]|nr:MAG: hypothetical protein A2Z96_02745 [Spirochaetes bacterium GWB1_48_6]
MPLSITITLMIPEYEKILEKSKSQQKEIQRQMLFLSKLNKKNFDHIVADYHDEVFAEIDCLKCGNCCRVLGPRFRDKDVKIIAKEIGTTPGEFVAEYLKADVDAAGYDLKTVPCPFLELDNSCNIYKKRPLSCEEFPYTQDHNIQRHLVRLAHNTLICPGAFLIVEKIMEEFCQDPEGH